MVAIGMLWALGCTSIPAPPPVDDAVVVPVEPPIALRLTDEAAVLEVAVDRYVRHDRTLVVSGTVHVADPAFYREAVGRLAAFDRVFVEGLERDETAPAGPGLPELGDVLGLVAQGDAVDPSALGWVVVDLTESELRRRLVADGADAAWVDDLFADGGSPLGETLARLRDAPERERALAKLTLATGLAAEPPEGPDAERFFRHVIAGRNAAVVEAIEALTPDVRSAAVWYGAAHQPDLGAQLRSRGWAWSGRQMRPAFSVAYADLGLGRPQVQLLLGR